MSQYDAYKRTIRQTATPRDVEYRLLAQVTAALIKAKDLHAGSDRDPRRMAQIMDALNWNNQVWDAFVEDVGTEGNMLPRELRAAIVSLGIWVTRETGMVAGGEGDIEALIAVNKAIMRGLNPGMAARDDEAAASEAAASAAPQPPR